MSSRPFQLEMWNVVQRQTSHKPNPSISPQGTWRSIPWATMICAVEGYYVTRWLTGLCSTQARVEGNVMNAAWNWGNNCSIVNDPLGEPGPTPMNVDLPPAWARWTMAMSSAVSWRSSLLGTLRNTNEWINHWLWKRGISVHKDPVGGQWSGGSFTVVFWGDGEVWFFRERFYWNLQRYVKESSGNGHLSPQGSVGKPGWGGGGHLPGTFRDSKRGLCKRSVYLFGSPMRGTWKRTFLYWELCKLRKTCQGRLWKRSVSFFMQAAWGEPGGRAPILRTPRYM